MNLADFIFWKGGEGDDKYEPNSFICHDTLREKISEIIQNHYEQAGRYKY
jgi:hypothetical protein